MRRRSSPWYFELPTRYVTARVVIPQRAEFHELWFTVFREGRLQPSVEALSKGPKVLLIVELGVLEPRWRRESKAGGRG